MPSTSVPKGRKILVVEDEALVALAVSTLMEDMGHLVCGVAASVDEALSLSREHAPDLVLMDVNLQEGGNGIDAARELRGFARPPRVLFITSYVDSETRRRMEETGPFGIVQKPYSEAHLQQTVEAALGGAPGADGSLTDPV
ncbi:MAG TPA: response regulator [Caulobacteraceae bacterium]|jgi:CheY-like chemotaxis protein